ncbi:MAG: AI-2E family transporter [Acidimicrobiales bacterium]|nr:AI-2E family transporter [Acidimicrobiales bacterium]
MGDEDIPPPHAGRPVTVPARLDRAAAWSWRLLVIGAAVVALGVVASRLRLVLLPVGVALLLSTALVHPAHWLTRRGLRPLLATWITMLGFLGAVVGIGVAIVPPLVDEFGDLGPTLEDAADEVEGWLIDGPLGVDQATIEDARDRVQETTTNAFSSNGALVDSAVIAGEVVAGIVLTLVVAFFLVKDGDRFQRWAIGWVPEQHRDRVRQVSVAAWSTLGRYLIGAASLGFVEAVIIGVTLTLTGSSVVLPVAALTFVGAFFPFVGAVVAGVIAVLVSLVSSGPEAALVVAVVAVLVQQFDNDLLAPVIYGRALKIHPLVVILAVTTGAAIGGFLGAFLAVPLAAVLVNATIAARDDPGEVTEPSEPDEPSDATGPTGAAGPA